MLRSKIFRVFIQSIVGDYLALLHHLCTTPRRKSNIVRHNLLVRNDSRTSREVKMYIHQKYPQHKPTTIYLSNRTKLFSPQMTIVSYLLYPVEIVKNTYSFPHFDQTVSIKAKLSTLRLLSPPQDLVHKYFPLLASNHG